VKQRGHWIGYDGVTNRTETTHVSEKINLAESLNSFSDLWSPRTVTEFNGHDVVDVKVEGEFVWHKHDDKDDDFLVLAKCSSSQRISSTVLSPSKKSMCC